MYHGYQDTLKSRSTVFKRLGEGPCPTKHSQRQRGGGLGAPAVSAPLGGRDRDDLFGGMNQAIKHAAPWTVGAFLIAALLRLALPRDVRTENPDLA